MLRSARRPDLAVLMSRSLSDDSDFKLQGFKPRRFNLVLQLLISCTLAVVYHKQ